jgi:hypothetical protein
VRGTDERDGIPGGQRRAGIVDPGRRVLEEELDDLLEEGVVAGAQFAQTRDRFGIEDGGVEAHEGRDDRESVPGE